ncbi:MAG: hypothetical protein ACLP1Q_15655 [Solirubrobacteraceae bacterium]
MGTSRSFRSPATPRWNAVIAQIGNDEPPAQIRAELFNAGNLDGWASELGRPAMSLYVEGLVEAHGSLGLLMRESTRPEEAIDDLVARTRVRALREEAAPALAIAERALTRTLLKAARTDRALADSTPQEAGGAFEAARGSPAELVQRFLGEVLHQYACHVVARDAGQIVGRGKIRGTREVRALERRLAGDALEIADRVRVRGTASELPSRWAGIVAEAFREAATRPGSRDG